MRGSATEAAVLAMGLAARHSTPGMDTGTTAADTAGGTEDMAGAMVDGAAALAAALDGASDLAGADSGIRSGGDRAGASVGERRTHIITTRIHTIRIGHRMARPTLTTTTIGAVPTARPATMQRPATHLTTMIPPTARTTAAGISTAMTAPCPSEEHRNRIRPARILRCLGRRFSFT